MSLWFQGTVTQQATLFLGVGTRIFSRDKRDKQLNTNCLTYQNLWDFSNANPDYTVSCYSLFWWHEWNNPSPFTSASPDLPWAPRLLWVLPYCSIFYCRQPSACLSCEVHQSLWKWWDLKNWKMKGGGKSSLFWPELVWLEGCGSVKPAEEIVTFIWKFLGEKRNRQKWEGRQKMMNLQG